MERAVQTFKTAMKKSNGNVDARLARFLFHYRTTPNLTTGVSPAELLMERKLKTHLDQLRSDLCMVGNSSRREVMIRKTVSGPSILITQYLLRITDMGQLGCLEKCKQVIHTTTRYQMEQLSTVMWIR